jgi:hypothetical protein
MAWPLVAGMVAASALSAGSSIMGSRTAAKAAQTKNTPVAGIDPYRDPSLNAAQILGMLAAGLPIDSVVSRASPLMQLQNALSQPNAGTADNRRAQKTSQAVAFLANEIGALEFGSKDMNQVMDAVNRFGYFPALTQAAGLSGYMSIQDLIAQEINFRKSANQLKSLSMQTAPAITKGRTDAQLGVAELQGLLPQLTQRITDYKLPGISEADILRKSEAERQRNREAIMHAANVGGFNPAAGLAEVERDPNPLANAIALMQAVQGLGVTDLNAIIAGNEAARGNFDSLYKSIYGPIESLNQTAGTALNAATGNASIAAQQAATAASLSESRGVSAGNGIAGAGQSLGSGLQSLAFLDALNQKQPTTATPASTSPYASNNSLLALVGAYR